MRGYRYAGSDVEVPPMRDYLIVAYRRGQTPMRRRVDGEWIHETLGPGDVSLLTRAAESHWVWPADIEVVHVYLTQDELANTCRQMYERDVQDVELHDVVKADDPAIHRTAMLIAHEAAQGAAGSRLMVDSLSCQLSVHILRRHADALFRESPGVNGLSFGQERTVRDYVTSTCRRASRWKTSRARSGSAATTSPGASGSRPARRRMSSSCGSGSNAPRPCCTGPIRRCSTSPAAADSPTRAT